MKRVLIAGCGDVGSRLGGLLARRGHGVWGLRRHPENLPEGIEPLAADLTDPVTLQDLPPDLDLVFYTAAAEGRSDEAYRQAYVDGVRHLLEALQEAGQTPQRILFTSSTGVYGQRDGSWVDETSPTEPESFTGRRVLEGEELLAQGPFPAVSLRLGGIYGPGRTRLLDRVRRGEATCPEGPPIYTNRIHSEDAAAALVHLGFLGTVESCYVGVDRRPADLCEVLRFLARRLEAPPPRTVPAESTDIRRGSKRCSSRRLFDSGFRFVYPTYREGYAEMIENLRGD